MNMVRSAAMIAAALASVMGCYTVSVRAAGERGAVVAANAAIARDMTEMRLLRAELRTRSRLPELQRWNAEVLALAAPRAEQLMTGPVMLAAYAVRGPAAGPAGPTPAVPAAPTPVATVVRDVPKPAPLLHQASFVAAAPSDLAADAARAGGMALPGGAPGLALPAGGAAQVVKVALR